MNIYTFAHNDRTIEVEARNYVAAMYRLMIRESEWTKYKHIDTQDK